MLLNKLGLAASIFTVAAFAQAADTPYQVGYASNLFAGDATLTLSSSGASSTTVNPQNGNLCANVYMLAPDSTLIGCCSCVVKPNALVSLSVKDDIAANPLATSSVVIKLMASIASASAPNCNPRTVGTGANVLATGLLSWHTIQSIATAPNGLITYLPTRLPLTPSTLSAAELTQLNSSCTTLLAGGSGACRSCRLGSQ